MEKSSCNAVRQRKLYRISLRCVSLYIEKALMHGCALIMSPHASRSELQFFVAPSSILPMGSVSGVLSDAILLFCWVVSAKLPFYVTLLISWMISLGFKWYLNHPFLGWSLGFLWLQRILSESAFIGVTCLDRTETITTPVDDATLLPEAPLAF